MTSIQSAFKKRTNQTKPLVAGALAVALAFGAAGAYSAWQETQEFTIEAAAKSLGMEYSLDGGATWHAFGGSVALPAIEEVDAETADVAYQLMFRNTGSHDVSMTGLEAVPSGTLFSGDNPATVSWGDTMNDQPTIYGGPSSVALSHVMTSPAIVMNPDGSTFTTHLNVQFDDLMDESYSGSTATIIITATFDQEDTIDAGGKED